jgi:hypothetical protein
MNCETFEQGTGKLLERRTLNYNTGVWSIYDGEGNLKSEYVMTDEEILEFNEMQKKLRENDFERESDSLHLKVDAGELDKQVWLNKREEIRERHKYILKK